MTSGYTLIQVRIRWHLDFVRNFSLPQKSSKSHMPFLDGAVSPAKNYPVRTNQRTPITRKHTSQHVRNWMLLLQLQICYNNIISCLTFYTSCIKKILVSPDGRK